MIVIIAFSLMPSALNNIIWQNSAAALFNPITFALAVITLVIAVAITKFGKGFFGQLGIIVALIIGYIASIALGLVDLTLY